MNFHFYALCVTCVGADLPTLSFPVIVTSAPLSAAADVGREHQDSVPANLCPWLSFGIGILS